jgi:6-pyruvoyltetrahydropterin/6-carboxytetrahydropterin synthase
MAVYRVCKRFTIESGHMLSKHSGRCRLPHGHTRTVEVVAASARLDANDMVLDFRALKLAIQDYLRSFDHAMALNAADPLLPALRATHPESVIVFEGRDPTTEVIAETMFRHIAGVLASGFECEEEGVRYVIPPGAVRLERLRLWETPDSWAEYVEE